MLVKRLVTIEDLGNIEVLFTDKTGTLTEGAITFDRALDPTGEPATQPLRFGLVCNEATMTATGPIGGNALDVALWVAPCGSGDSSPAPTRRPTYERLGLLPFDHDRQLSSVVVRAADGETLLVTKGAPEVAPGRSASTFRPTPTTTLQRLFADGARVVAVATRDACPGSPNRQPPTSTTSTSSAS